MSSRSKKNIFVFMILLFTFFVGTIDVNAASCPSGFDNNSGTCSKTVMIKCKEGYEFDRYNAICKKNERDIISNLVKKTYGNQYIHWKVNQGGYVIRIRREAYSSECSGTGNPYCEVYDGVTTVYKDVSPSVKATCVDSTLNLRNWYKHCAYNFDYAKELSSCSEIDLSSYPKGATATSLNDYSCKISFKLDNSSASDSGSGTSQKGDDEAIGEMSGGITGTVTVSTIADKIYDGQEITPSPTVKVGTKTLTKGTDYTLSYLNNNRIGTATVVVKGKGTYANLYITKNFVIKGKLIYKANGGTGSDVTQTVTYNQQTNVKAYTIFKRDRYEIIEWNTEADGSGESWTIENTNNAKWKWNRRKNVTLYAIWRPIRVIYDANGGYAINHPNGVERKYTSWYEEVPENGKYVLQDNWYTRRYYTFVGWNEKKDGTGTDWTSWYANNYTSTGQNYWQWNYKSYPRSVTLYAIWRPTTYTIKYNANGGTGTMADQTYGYSEKYKLRKNTFTKAGYEFIGWQDPTGAIWDDEYSGVWRYDNGQWGISNATLSLTAVWRATDAEPDTIEGDYISVTVHDTPEKFSKRRGFKNYQVYNKSNQTRDKTSKFVTGDKFDTTTKSYTIIVIGDPTCDGESNLSDIMLIYNKMKGQKDLDTISTKAADVNDDSQVNMIDILNIYTDMVDRK